MSARLVRESAPPHSYMLVGARVDTVMHTKESASKCNAFLVCGPFGAIVQSHKHEVDPGCPLGRDQRATQCLSMHFTDETASYRTARIMSAAFSAIITTGQMVLHDTSVGMVEQATTRKPAMPCTRNCGSTTASASMPILQVPEG